MIPKQMNLALSFALELLMLGAVGYWGHSLHVPTYLKLVCAISIPVLLAVAWGFFFAPKANHRLPMPWLLFCKLILFCGSAIALSATDKSYLTWPYAGLIAINLVFVVLWKQY